PHSLDVPGPHQDHVHLLVSPGRSRTSPARADQGRTRRRPMKSSTTFAGLLEAFFIDRLVHQRQVSPHTIVSYRETFRQLLRFAQDRLKKPPSQLLLEDLDAPLIGTFLDQAEKVRGLSARSRNVRLAAIRSFFRYVALEAPRRSALVQRVMVMPNKKFEKRQ